VPSVAQIQFTVPDEQHATDHSSWHLGYQWFCITIYV